MNRGVFVLSTLRNYITTHISDVDVTDVYVAPKQGKTAIYPYLYHEVRETQSERQSVTVWNMDFRFLCSTTIGTHTTDAGAEWRNDIVGELEKHLIAIGVHSHTYGSKTYSIVGVIVEEVTGLFESADTKIFNCEVITNVKAIVQQ
jgi:hypothetical protein